MNIKQQEKYFKTSDLALASAISLWFQIQNIDKENPRKAQFIFEASPKLSELVEKYWRGDLAIEPQAFFAQIKIIKSRLYG